MMASVTLTSSDCEQFEISRKAASRFEAIDLKSEATVFKVDVISEVLEQVIDWAKNHENDQDPEPGEEEAAISDADQQFFEEVEADKGNLFEVIIATKTLQVNWLQKVLCARLVRIIEGKTDEELRMIFGIRNDFTPEEYERTRRENEWVIQNGGN